MTVRQLRLAAAGDAAAGPARPALHAALDWARRHLLPRRQRPQPPRREAGPPEPHGDDASPAPMLVVDRHGRVLDVNAAFLRRTGHATARDLGGKPLRALLAWRHDDDNTHHQLWRSACDRGHWQGRVWLRCCDGSAQAAWLTIDSLAAGDTPGAGNFIVVVAEPGAGSPRHDARHHVAWRDPLTGLPDRRVFTRDLARAIERARRHGRGCALMRVDLDHFKWTNVGFGHAVGDRVLAEVACRLQQSVRAEDTVAHLGSDDFALLLEDMANPHDAARMAAKVIAAVGKAVQVDGQPVSVSASVGVALFPGCGIDAAELMHAAGAALASAKRRGRRTFAFSAAADGDTDAADRAGTASSPG